MENPTLWRCRYHRMTNRIAAGVELSWPETRRQDARAVNGRAREVQLPKTSRAQKIMSESQTLDIICTVGV